MLEEYLALHSADTDVLFRYAEVCWRLGLVDNARESLERSLYLNLTGRMPWS